jgi:uncharacterized low-complexity protein
MCCQPLSPKRCCLPRTADGAALIPSKLCAASLSYLAAENSRPSQTVATRTNFEQAITGRCQERNCSAEKLPAANSFCIRTDCARFSKGAVGSGSSCCRQMKVQAQFQRKLPAGNLSSATHWLYPPPVRVQTIRSIDRLRSNSLGTAQRRLSGTLSAGIVPQG